MTVLDLQGLGKAFGPVMAVKGVDLRLAPGTRTAVVGPSGCGKTTLLRLIAGFEAPDAGRILLNDRLVADATGAVPTHLRGIGLVAQDGALFPHLSVADNIGFGLPRDEVGQAQRIAGLADITGLPRAALTRWPHELSGGQQQRVALARALAQKPQLMLLDEPFSSLDAGLRATMRQAVIKLLADAGIASILVTHDQAEALSYADQVAVMYDGAFLQVGPPRDLYWRPRTRRTAEFLGDAVILPARITGNIAECALGRVQMSTPKGDGHARLMLRPEQVHLVPSVGPQGAPPNGKVIAVEFGGETSVVTVELAVGPAVVGDVECPTLLHLRQPSTVTMEAGDMVTFAITGTAHILDEPGPAPPAEP